MGAPDGQQRTAAPQQEGVQVLGDPSQEMLSFKEVYLFVGAPSRPPARLVLLLPRVGHHLLCSMPTAGEGAQLATDFQV